MKTSPRRRPVAACVFVLVSGVLLLGADCDFEINIPLYNMEDVGGYWAKGEIDPQLAGRWYATKKEHAGAFLEFRKTAAGYEIVEKKPDEEKEKVITLAKTLRIGKRTFMMWKSKEDAKPAAKEGEKPEPERIGILLRYTIADDRLTLSILTSDALVKAAEDKRWKDVIEVKRRPRKDPKKDEPKEKVTVSVPRLNEKTLELLRWLAEKDENWQGPDDMTLTRKPPALPRVK